MAKRARTRAGQPQAEPVRRRGAGFGTGEFRSGTEVQTALLDGVTFKGKAVQYTVVDGLAIVEGDIVLGTAEEVRARTEHIRLEMSGQVTSGVIRSGAQFRWPNCTIPYTIDPALPNQARVTDAIAHWQDRTRYRFVVRTTETDYVTFRPSSGCSSSVGRQGGQQFVNLGSGCTTGNTIHEIGHVVGLWHEQSREDRDAFVTINWAKITPGYEHNFNQHIADGDDVGAYDYGSIMHYPRNAFSVDGSDTITPVDPAAVIGQRTALSAGDVAAANSMCPKPIKEAPKDIRVETIKEIQKDIRLDTRKEIVLDTRKEVALDTRKEIALDTRKEGPLDPPTTLAENVVTPGQPPVGPIQPGFYAGTRPFAIATPQPSAGGVPQGDQAAAEIAQLDAQLQELAEQIAQNDAQRSVLQAQYDETAALLQQAIAAREASGGSGEGS